MSFYGSCLTFTILITWAGARSAQAQPCSVRRSLALSSKIFAASSPHAVSARLALTRSCLSVGFSLSRALIAYGLRFGGIPNDLCALRERERERERKVTNMPRSLPTWRGRRECASERLVYEWVVVLCFCVFEVGKHEFFLICDIFFCPSFARCVFSVHWNFLQFPFQQKKKKKPNIYI